MSLNKRLVVGKMMTMISVCMYQLVLPIVDCVTLQLPQLMTTCE